ncbi:MAG: TetR family transcriptional regulator C-terminal domain-containing protein [Pseudomonadota bacterium]
MNTQDQLHSDATATSARERILQAAHEEMYEHGFQGLRIDAVLKKTQLAKGALYHYFPNKLALGYAVVDERIMGEFQQNWSASISFSLNPLQALKDFFQKKCGELQSGECANGCPLTNLMQEMSTLDDGFHQRLQTVMMSIVSTVATALHQGQADGIVCKDINPQKISLFVLSSYQGIMGVAKCTQSIALTVELFDTLAEYVDSLGAPQQ